MYFGKMYAGIYSYLGVEGVNAINDSVLKLNTRFQFRVDKLNKFLQFDTFLGSVNVMKLSNILIHKYWLYSPIIWKSVLECKTTVYFH